MSVEIHPERRSCSYLWHPSNCLLWHDFLLKLGTEKSVTAHLPSEQRKTDAIWGGVSESFHSLAPRHLQRACMCKWSLTFHLQAQSSVLIIACGETFLSPEALIPPCGSHFENLPPALLFFRGKLLGKSCLQGHSKTASSNGFFLSGRNQPKSTLNTWVWGKKWFRLSSGGQYHGLST